MWSWKEVLRKQSRFLGKFVFCLVAPVIKVIRRCDITNRWRILRFWLHLHCIWRLEKSSRRKMASWCYLESIGEFGMLFFEVAKKLQIIVKQIKQLQKFFDQLSVVGNRERLVLTVFFAKKNFAFPYRFFHSFFFCFCKDWLDANSRKYPIIRLMKFGTDGHIRSFWLRRCKPIAFPVYAYVCLRTIPTGFFTLVRTMLQSTLFFLSYFSICVEFCVGFLRGRVGFSR